MSFTLNQIISGNISSSSVNPVKSITIPSPASSEIFTLFYTKSSSTLTKIVSVVKGSNTPSVSFNIRYGSNRSLTGTAVTSSAITTSSTTTGTSTTTFSSSTIPADNFVWIEVTAVSGTVDELNISLIF